MTVQIKFEAPGDARKELGVQEILVTVSRKCRVKNCKLIALLQSWRTPLGNQSWITLQLLIMHHKKYFPTH